MKKNLKTFIIIVAAVLLVLFFLPVASLHVISYSSMHLMTNGQALFGLKLLFPAAIIVLWLFIKTDKKPVISLGLSVAELAACVLGYFLMKDGGGFGGGSALGAALSMAANAAGIKVSLSVWFFLEILLALVLIVLSFLALRKGAEADLGGSLKDLGSEIGNLKMPGSGTEKAAALPRRICKYCGTPLKEGSDFCGNCGTRYVPPKTKNCVSCGAKLEEDDLFCPVCGAKNPAAEAERLCIKCGHSFGAENDFCPYCGKKYVDPEKRICRQCGAELPVGADFCGKCGTRFE